MPKYRQIHTKILDSFDFNDAPDDFTRLTWILLFLILDSEGRGIDDSRWINSKMYPLRKNVTDKRIEKAIAWMADPDRSMVIRYEVEGRHYLCIPKFKDYQTGTYKEAPSLIPAPTPELLRSNSGATPEQVGITVAEQVGITESASASAYESESESESAAELKKKELPVPPANLAVRVFLDAWGEWQKHRREIKHKLTPLAAEKQLKMLEKFDPMTAAAMLNQSILHGWVGIFEIKTDGKTNRGETSQEFSKRNIREFMEQQNGNSE